MAEPLNIIVIGSGPGGEAAAKAAAARGARVTLIEKNRLGGLCLNWGCIPSKALLESIHTLHAARAAADVFSGAEGLRLRWERLQKKKDDLVQSLRDALSKNHERLNIRVVEGSAAFEGPGAVTVEGAGGTERFPFDAAVVAAGSAPFFPPPFDSLREKVLDSDRVLSLGQLPERLLVVGGGAVGCEFACLFQELGTAVTILEKKDGLLPGEDPAAVRVLQAAFEGRGIRVIPAATVRSAALRGALWSVELSNGETLTTEEILVSVGRHPAAEGLKLERAGVRMDGGRPAVNERLQTSNPKIYAVGDVNGLSLLAHAAAAQAETVVGHLFGEDRPYQNMLVPRCLYTWPEVASVGEWAHSAKDKGLDAKTQRFFFQGSAKALAANEGEGFIQAVSEKSSGRLLGAQIVGPHATELIHIFSVALAAGLTTDQLRRVVFAHPTLSEGVREALTR